MAVGPRNDMSKEDPTYDEIVAEERAFRKKVNDIFVELAGDRAKALCGYSPETLDKISAALVSTGTEEKVARETAFHLTDINDDLAFLIAVHLFPERFTPEEIDQGVGGALIHMPHHIIAAARLNHYSTDDVFAEANEPTKHL
jgi:hypothetical protein